MASPVTEGTASASPFLSRYVDIEKERILIIPDREFQTADLEIEYHIKAHKSGDQIPFLFYASDFRQDFKIWVDGKETALKQVPSHYRVLEGSPFTDFSHLFEEGDNKAQVVIDESPSTGFYVDLKDLKFFKTSLSEGDHIIRIAYTASVWVDRSEWVNEYSFRYALSPAKYWKSFGELEIILDASNFQEITKTNLGEPIAGDFQSKARWAFSSLPTEVLKISYTPEISLAAKVLIAVSPNGLALFFAVIVITFHFAAIKRYRKYYPDSRFSLVMIAGSFVLPLVILLGAILSYSLVDEAIGPHAGRYHGYTFVIILLYPFLLPVYGIAMWLADRRIKRKAKRMNEPRSIVTA